MINIDDWCKYAVRAGLPPASMGTFATYHEQVGYPVDTLNPPKSVLLAVAWLARNDKINRYLEKVLQCVNKSDYYLVRGFYRCRPVMGKALPKISIETAEKLVRSEHAFIVGNRLMITRKGKRRIFAQ